MTEKLWLKVEKNKSFSKLISGLAENNIENFLVEGCKILLEGALEEEVSDFLHRERYTRRFLDEEEEFRGYRNGYQDVQYKSMGGRIHLKKPRVRQSPDLMKVGY